MTTEAAARAEGLARAAYGRLLAILAARDGDIETAEDCLADAFAQALDTWPRAGIPANPDAWLLTVARNRQRDVHRSAGYRLSDSIDEVSRERVLATAGSIDPDDIPDRRLALLFVCAHPAIDAAARTPLMLQVVLGVEVARIADAFATPATTMAQRLVRAKRRIREARIPFVVPGREQLAARLPPVLEAIYGAYAIDFPLSGTEARGSLAGEAHFLATTLAELMPDEPEALGLAALIALSLARRAAGSAGGSFIPLDEQSPASWDPALIAQGEAYLRRASAHGQLGRFQLEAAIASAHCARTPERPVDWEALLALHSALVQLAPTLGVRIAHAAVVGRVHGAAAGVAALDAIDDAALPRFQPAWATRAHLLAEDGRTPEAGAAYARAIALTTDAGARRWLEARRKRLAEGHA